MTVVMYGLKEFIVIVIDAWYSLPLSRLRLIIVRLSVLEWGGGEGGGREVIEGSPTKI